MDVGYCRQVSKNVYVFSLDMKAYFRLNLYHHEMSKLTPEECVREQQKKIE